MKTIRQLFEEHNDKLIHKWDHYLDIYEHYFFKYRGEEINILEIGISHGGSIQLWKKYFGKQAHIYAMDVNPECKKLQEEGVTIFIGSQSDPVFLNDIISKLPPLDIIIDDGGHTMEQQKTSFKYLFSQVKQQGFYIVEDTHTSYWHEFHGGYKNRNSFIEYSKNMIDALHNEHINSKENIQNDDIIKNIYSIAFFDSIVVFEKKFRNTPFHVQKGKQTINSYKDDTLKKDSLLLKIRKKFLGYKSAAESFGRNSK